MEKVKNDTVRNVVAAKNDAIISQSNAEGSIRNPTLLGAGTEKLINEALSSFLPERFSIISGALIGAQGEISSQTDLIVYDKFRSSPPATSMNLIPCESAVAAIEVKRSLRSSQLKKSIADSLIIKTIQRCKTELLEENDDESSQIVKKVTMPYFQHCSFATILQHDSLSLIARKWHHQYFDVPFGCQLDSIVCLQKGMITLAAWYPNLGYSRNNYSPVFGIQLFETNPTGRSIILFPDFFSKTKPLRIRVTPRLDFQIGTMFFLAETHYGRDTLSAWMHFLSSYIKGLMILNYESLSNIGDFYDIASEYKTRFIPLAIAVDADNFANNPDLTIKQGIMNLLSCNEESVTNVSL